MTQNLLSVVELGRVEGDADGIEVGWELAMVSNLDRMMMLLMGHC